MQEFVVTGEVHIDVPVELPNKKAELKKIADKIGYTGEVTVEAIAKAIVLEAIRKGLDDMEYRQSEPSSVDEYELEVEFY